MTQRISVQLRFVQGTKRSRSLTVGLPSYFCDELGIEKGDLMVIRKDKKRLVLEKVFVVPEYDHKE
jgi:hypothetical protein